MDVLYELCPVCQGSGVLQVRVSQNLKVIDCLACRLLRVAEVGTAGVQLEAVERAQACVDNLWDLVKGRK